MPCNFFGIVKIPDLPDLVSKPIRDDWVFAKETCNYQGDFKGAKRGRMERFNIVIAVPAGGLGAIDPDVVVLVHDSDQYAGIEDPAGQTNVRAADRFILWRRI